MKAIDIGRRHVQVVTGATLVTEVARIMRLHEVSCVVVAEASLRPEGIISERDIVLRAMAAGADLGHLTAAAIMSTPAVVCHADATLADIVQAMAGGAVAHLPLVDDRHRLVGIVSATDVTAAVTELLGQLARALASDALTDRPYG
ncbi:MAG TPA: CBS domain-containing protein [Luteibacter sp.]|uniref:CBS domain-containing protein n=1 Tax=Luteibacter sp. TaxID=1886636 RepID=UPI002C83A5A9|nr:CBS domain-containing protein [Luteibacter sp.]HVI55965.1 CBS domain-containing protein [Luteibacter sp.]